MSGDLRRPVDADLIAAPSEWTVDVVAETGSTNADLIAASADTASRTVLVAETQLSARGRLDRAWTSPPGAGLTFSVLVRPSVPKARWAWLPLLTGVALVQAITALAGDDSAARASMKWPNDLLLAPDSDTEPDKAAGILLASSGDAVVIGIGLNVSTTADELPVPTATSLTLSGVPVTSREAVLSSFLAAFAELLQGWEDADGDAEGSGLAAEYRRTCHTLGRDVRVHLADDVSFTGRARDIDEGGRLLVATDAPPAGVPVDESGHVAVSAGDIVHLRPA